MSSTVIPGLGFRTCEQMTDGKFCGNRIVQEPSRKKTNFVYPPPPHHTFVLSFVTCLGTGLEQFLT